MQYLTYNRNKDVFTPRAKQKAREKLEKQVAEFKKAGGKIQKIQTNWHNY
jgi:hypothetical protein